MKIKNKRLTITPGTILISIALGAILISMAVMSSGCTNKSIGFHVISKEIRIDGMIVKEVVDENTGVHYYVNTNLNQGLMCPVYNSDGTIKTDKEK